MKPQFITVGATIAVWLASPALNSAYVPWGANGVYTSLASAAAIWVISVFTMSMAFRRSNVEDIKTHSYLLTILISFLALGEVAFWSAIDDNNNKPMLLRISTGIQAGWAATILSIIGTIFSYRYPIYKHEFSRYFKSILISFFAFVMFEILLIVLMRLFYGTLWYYAIDCAVFATAIIFLAMCIASFCIGFSRSQR